MTCRRCDHEQSRHAGGSGGCRKCDFGCRAFQDPNTPQVLERDGESTSAALARVTQERDYHLGVNEGLRRTVAELTAEVERLVGLGSRKMAELSDLQGLAEGFRRTIAELIEERDEAKAALLNLAAGAHLLRAADFLSEHDAWACLADDGCGRRYGYPDPETHELTCGRRLTPVRITITRREVTR